MSELSDRCTTKSRGRVVVYRPLLCGRSSGRRQQQAGDPAAARMVGLTSRLLRTAALLLLLCAAYAGGAPMPRALLQTTPGDTPPTGTSQDLVGGSGRG